MQVASFAIGPRIRRSNNDGRNERTCTKTILKFGPILSPRLPRSSNPPKFGVASRGPQRPVQQRGQQPERQRVQPSREVLPFADVEQPVQEGVHVGLRALPDEDQTTHPGGEQSDALRMSVGSVFKKI